MLAEDREEGLSGVTSSADDDEINEEPYIEIITHDDPVTFVTVHFNVNFSLFCTFLKILSQFCVSYFFAVIQFKRPLQGEYRTN